MYTKGQRNVRSEKIRASDRGGQSRTQSKNLTVILFTKIKLSIKCKEHNQSKIIVIDVENMANYLKLLMRKQLNSTPEQQAQMYTERCIVRVLLGALKKAKEDASQAISLNPDYAKGHYARGRVMYSMKRFEKAKNGE